MRRTKVVAVADLLAPADDENPLMLMVRAVELAVTEDLTPIETVALIDELELRTGLAIHPKPAT